MLTADTITDEQIREVDVIAGKRRDLDLGMRCGEALINLSYPGTSQQASFTRYGARAYLAEFINAGFRRPSLDRAREIEQAAGARCAEILNARKER